MKSKQDKHRKRIEALVANARHMSKPHADGVVVIRDASGRWLFELYPGKSARKATL